MTEIRQRDLRLVGKETADFLNRTMGLALSPQTVEALESRTEGWAVGLQLAALALQETRDEAGAEAFNSRWVGTWFVLPQCPQSDPFGRSNFLRRYLITLSDSTVHVG